MSNTIIKSIGNKLRREATIEAISVASGIAMGPAFKFRRLAFNIDEYKYKVTDLDREIAVFQDACLKTIQQLEQTRNISLEVYDKHIHEIFDSQIAILKDDVFLAEIESAIRKYKRPAVFALSRIFKKKKDYFSKIENDYFRDRAFDIEDIYQKLLHAIFGVTPDYQLSLPSIVFAENLTPEDTIHFNRNFILGFVTDSGGKTSHSAIMAQSLHIPSVVNEQRLSQVVENGDFVILDGYHGNIIINPDKKTTEEYIALRSRYLKREDELRKKSGAPVNTTDGVVVEVLANVEFTHELSEAIECSADGIGLFRTEGIFLGRERLPDEEEQYQIYKKFSDTMRGKQIILRTVDAGGDKLLSGEHQIAEQNPFLGWRGIRFCLDEKEIFKTQLRAILRANENGNMKILLPMVSCVTEIDETRKLLNEVENELNENGMIFNRNTQIGIMIETPSAAMLADQFAQRVDFFSIGSNDLTQYTLAVDRTNQKIAKLFNDMHPAVLRMIEKTIQSAAQAEIEVSICGELAGNPKAVALLLGMGLRKLSVNSALIPGIKNVIRSISMAECEALARRQMNANSSQQVLDEANKYYESKFPESELFN